MTKETKEILKKMCTYVDVKFEDINFSEEGWFLRHTWTEEQEDDFSFWLKTTYKRKHGKRIANSIASEFILSYGWRTDEGVPIDDVIKKLK